MARRREGGSLRETVVRRSDAKPVEIGETLEDRSHGIAGAVGDLRGRRHGHHGIFPKQRNVCLDDELLGPLASQAATIDAGWFGGKRFGHGAIAEANAARGRGLDL